MKRFIARFWPAAVIIAAAAAVLFHALSFMLSTMDYGWPQRLTVSDWTLAVLTALILPALTVLAWFKPFRRLAVPLAVWSGTGVAGAVAVFVITIPRHGTPELTFAAFLGIAGLAPSYVFELVGAVSELADGFIWLFELGYSLMLCAANLVPLLIRRGKNV